MSVDRKRSLRWADRSSRGVLPSVFGIEYDQVQQDFCVPTKTMYREVRVTKKERKKERNKERKKETKKVYATNFSVTGTEV